MWYQFLTLAVLFAVYNRIRQNPSNVDKATSSLPQVKPASLAFDDLTCIKGIGPKTAELLRANGIITFTQLAETEVERLAELLRTSGFPVRDLHTWAEQARLAAGGKTE